MSSRMQLRVVGEALRPKVAWLWLRWINNTDLNPPLVLHPRIIPPLQYIDPELWQRSNQLHKNAMEVCGQAQVFIEWGDDYHFDHTKIILRKGNNEYFYAKTSLRIPQSSRIDVDGLDTIPIPTSHVWPLADPTFTRAPEPLPYTCYVKQPSFLNYEDTTDGQDYARQILAEVEACEILRLHPHPNIARYLGCVVEDGRIKGLCFPKYVTTLSQMLRDKTDFDRARFQREIEAGVEHMHKLGLVHGDLNPTNIMLDGDSAVIIDFDSCKKEGDRLGSKAGTPGWELDDTEYARRENDLYSLSLIAGALTNK